MIAAISRKKGTHTGFTNDNKTITNTITFGIKNGPWETLPFFPFSSPFLLPFLSLSCPFSCLFLYSSFSFSFPFSCPFSFPFSFPFPFLFLSFSFPFTFFFLSLSFSFPFPLPFLFLSLSFSLLSFTIPFPFPRSCEFFDQGVIRGKKDNVWKNHLKELGVFTHTQVDSDRIGASVSNELFHAFLPRNFGQKDRGDLGAQGQLPRQIMWLTLGCTNSCR